jgi:hypothetical protein
MSNLLDLAIAAHGGLDRWKAIRHLDLTLTLTGGLYFLKGHPEGLGTVSLRVETQRQEAVITPYVTQNQRGRFTPDRVWIEDVQGHPILSRDNPRQSFAGHELMTPWDQLHRLYFSSYAMWNYLNTPFIFTLPDVETQELESHVENGETWRKLRVRFPASVTTHCAEQDFYFNEQGLLQRLDYVTDVLGGVASHYCFDHREFGGLVIPTLRRVVRRDGNRALLSTATAVLLQISDVRATTGKAAP